MTNRQGKVVGDNASAILGREGSDMSENQSETHRRSRLWLERGKILLMLIGTLAVVRFGYEFVTPSFQVKVIAEDTSIVTPEHTPPIFLVESRWGGLVRNEYPMRYRKDDWEYRKGNRWHSLWATRIASEIDIEPIDTSDGRRLD